MDQRNYMFCKWYREGDKCVHEYAEDSEDHKGICLKDDCGVYFPREEMKEIEHENKVFHKVGCKNCGSGNNNWNVYSDGEGFVAVCRCGHKVVIRSTSLKDQPDNTHISMNMVV